MTTAKFSGYLDHIERYLGPVRDVSGPGVTGTNRGFALFFCPSPGGELISVVTNGLRFQQIMGVMPQELVCTLHADQEQIAHMLTARTADLVMSLGSGLSVDQLVSSETPLADGTEIYGVMAMSHPYADEGFDALVNDDGKAELQIITLIPVLRQEIAFVAANTVDALYDHWEADDTDLLDGRRTA